MIDFELEDTGLMEEPEAIYSINKELNLAWDIVENTGSNLFLTGKAGTGKTTFLKRLKRDSKKNMIVLAPTGVAAINAGGATIHSFFQFPFSPFIPGRGFISGDKKFLNINKNKRLIISSLSLLVIDEISMVRPDMLDAIDQTLRRMRNSRLPFGGVQLLLIGDLRQLSPVVKDEEWKYLSDYYKSPYFFDSIALKNAGYHSIELTKVFRQSDRDFIEILNNIREGKADSKTLQRLNSLCYRGSLPSNTEGYIRLTTHNYRAAQINNSKLAELPGAEWEFEAKISGKFPEYSYPADKTLMLKEGAQVMFNKNDTGQERRFYNGMIGTVVSLAEEKIRVRPIGSEGIVDVTPMEWENLVYTADETTGEIKQEEAGKFVQFPLQLAWAITIHKSQGLTFDKAIIDAAYSFAAGQTYVALSRCRSLEGVVLENPITPQAIIIDKEANDFINYCESHSPSDELIASCKNQYLASLFCELFDFDQIGINLSDFIRLAFEYVVPMHEGSQNVLKKIEDLWTKKVQVVSKRFIGSQNPAILEKELTDPERKLIERIKKGCSYFHKELEEINRLIDSIPRNLNNQGYATRLKNAYDSLENLLALKLEVLKWMEQRDFSIENYLKGKNQAPMFLERQRLGDKISKKVRKPRKIQRK